MNRPSPSLRWWSRAAGPGLVAALSACSWGAPKAVPTSTKATPAEVQAPAALTLGKAEVLLEEGGLRLDRFTWSADTSSGLVWRVRLPRGAVLDVVPSDAVQPLGALVSASTAALPAPWAAINGGFYEQGPMGLVVSEGKVNHPADPRGGSGILIAQPGPASIIHRDAWTEGPVEALQSVDRIVDGRKNLVSPAPGAHRDARSAVALSEKYVWLVVAAASSSVRETPDGVALEHSAGRGLTLHELGTLLVSTTAADTALNLDGAVSSQMMVVTSARRWSIEGEKGTINALVARSPAAP